MSKRRTPLDRVTDEETRELLRAAGMRHLDWFAGPSDSDDESVRTVRLLDVEGNGRPLEPNGGPPSAEKFPAAQTAEPASEDHDS